MAMTRLVYGRGLDWQVQLPDGLSDTQQALMLTTDSLTLAFNQACGEAIDVAVWFEGVMNSETEMAWIREVCLQCRGRAVLYALSRVYLQDDAAKQAFVQGQHPFSTLLHLGQQPLGYWLAEQQDMRRSPFDYAMSQAGNWQLTPRLLLSPETRLPTRRSCLFRVGQSLELTEVFL
jgi:chorismate-pyruvate lyase